MQYRNHPIADVFPMMTDDELRALADDIATNGLLNHITLLDGAVLDGRNRMRACEMVDVTPQVMEYSGDDPLGFVWSQNVHRRHMTESQRAMTAAKIANWSIGRRNSNTPAGVFDVSQSQAAAQLDVGTRSVSRAKSVLDSGNEELIADVDAGRKTLSQADRELTKIKAMESVKPLPDGKYGVLYCDPPWNYDDKLAELDAYGGAEKHYPCMTQSELKALDVRSLVADDAVMFMWATVPLLPQALELLSAWGFIYKTNFIWDKDAHNMGHYSSVRHEILLLGVKGRCPICPVVGTEFNGHSKLIPSVQKVKRTKTHSEKPELFRGIIDHLYPNGSRVELFSRTEIEGWTSWGTQNL